MQKETYKRSTYSVLVQNKMRQIIGTVQLFFLSQDNFKVLLI